MLHNDPERALQMAAGIGGLWLMGGFLREGCTWLDRALEAAPDPTPARADALHARQALDRRRPESYDFAERLSEERVGIHHLRGDVRGECLALLDLADGFLLRGKFDAAADIPAHVAEMAESLGEPGLIAAARERAGIGAAWRHDYDAAWPAFDEATELCAQAPADAAPSSAVVSLACFLVDTGPQFSYPIVRFEETGLHFRRLPPAVARASLLSHHAYLHRSIGQFADARAALDSALAIVEAAGIELDVARLAAQRGMVEAAAGDVDAAEHWLERSLADRRRLREHRGILVTLTNLAVVAASRGEMEQGETLLAQAGRMAHEAVDGPGMGAVYLGRAEIARHAGRPADAHEAIEQAIEVIYALAGLAHELAWFRLQQAYLSLELGDLTAVERELATARELFTECGIPLGHAYCAAVEQRVQAANAPC
jgi:tetratricopeptide (TPR) repeat protein